MTHPIHSSRPNRAWCLVLLACAGQLAAQAAPPPRYIEIFREQVKVGRGAAHVPAEAGWPRAFARAKIPNYYVALTTSYGPLEAWFVDGRDAIGQIDDLNGQIQAAPGLNAELDRLSAADAANISDARVILGRYQPSMSNGPDIDAAEMRVWEVIIFRVKPGHEAQFGKAAALYRTLVEKAQVIAPWATYEVMAGMQGPTYLVWVPHKTLAEIDPAVGVGAAIEAAMTDSMGMQFGSLAEGYYSSEDMIFTVSPEMSYPPPEFVKQDPAFWGRKAKVPPKTPTP
jgi:hypothetical protein